MSNKKLIIGIAAGVAALAVVGILLKRKGYLDGVISKAEEFGSDLADKYETVKESAKKKFDEVVQKGGEIANKVSGHAASAQDATTSSKAAGSNPATA
ncbi:hypothetical protein [uncultured Flavobacterium sp.]|uniref:hypothetical protein n=1 Tax=uncultured Flavobacterium sp. TaxID=165435 RepID=UPI0025CF338B|nr:hypothetical protein [uncultured Flavobacterium sp.]